MLHCNVCLVVNETIDGFATNAGNDTYDNIYLPSAQEMLNSDYGFSESHFRSYTRGAKNSDFAITCGANMDTSGLYAGNGYYRLRSIGESQDYVALVNPDGYLYRAGDKAHYSFAIRPVLHLDLSTSVWQKAGTATSLEAITPEVTPSPTPTATPTATPAPKQKKLQTPVISVKKKSTMGIRYNKIKKYKGHIYLQYEKKKQTLYIKVRTYKIKNKKKIYSKFSKVVRIRT